MGVDPGAVLTRELIHPDDRAMRERVLAGAVDDPWPLEPEFRAVRPHRTVVWMLAHTRGVCGQTGRVVRVIGTNQVITKAKQAEQGRGRLPGRRDEVLDGQQQRLAAAVAELATATRGRAGLDACEVTVDLDGPPLNPVVETVLFRVAQQALATVEQPAKARQLRVALYREGPEVVLVVQADDGGFDPTRTRRSPTPTASG
jgi:hypothetical protein